MRRTGNEQAEQREAEEDRIDEIQQDHPQQGGKASVRIDSAMEPVEIPVRPHQPEQDRIACCRRDHISDQRQASDEQQHEGVEMQRHDEVIVEEIAALVEMGQRQHQRIERQQEEHHGRRPALHRGHQGRPAAVNDPVDPQHHSFADLKR